MKKTLKVFAAIALLLVVYYLLQLLFVTLSAVLFISVGVSAGTLPAESLELIGEIQHSSENTALAACMVNARALGIFLSALSMLFFIHFTGFYKLRWGLLRSVAPRPLLISTLLVFSSMFALNIFVQWFPLEDNLTDIFSGLSRNALGVVGLAFLAPLLEEVLFRGAIQGALIRLFGRPWPAIIVAALVFGIFHFNPVQIVYATLLGIVFGWIYYRTGSLLSVIVGHVLNNSLAVVTTIVFGAGEEQAVAESSIGITGFLLFALLSLYLATQLNKAVPPVGEKTEF